MTRLIMIQLVSVFLLFVFYNKIVNAQVSTEPPSTSVSLRTSTALPTPKAFTGIITATSSTTLFPTATTELLSTTLQSSSLSPSISIAPSTSSEIFATSVSTTSETSQSIFTSLIPPPTLIPQTTRPITQTVTVSDEPTTSMTTPFNPSRRLNGSSDKTRVSIVFLLMMLVPVNFL